MACVAIVQATGIRCTRASVAPSDRCKVHTDCLKRNGPHKTERNELKAVYERDLKEIYSLIPGGIGQQEYSVRLRDRIAQYNRDKVALNLKHLNYVMEHGDPDQVAKDVARAHLARRREQFAIREQERQLRNQERVQQIMQNLQEDAQRDLERRQQHFNRIAEEMDQNIAILNGERRHNAGDINEDIKVFASDNQNVHTTIVVKQTKNIINEILKIEVPEEYRWNKYIVSKTVGEVISACKLSINAMSTMTNRYTMDEATYGLFEGVYGKVLDAIWQFIVNHADKDCLIKILKTELEDSRGMCSQGTLARLTNVLAGYVDYIKKIESPAEIMGRLMTGISEITDNKLKAERITSALIESKMPDAEWKNWIDDDEFEIQNNVVVVV